MSQSLLRTETSDVRKPDRWSRGSRYWSQAEVLSNTIFIVEGSQAATEFAPELPMCFVTPNFFEVNQICHAWSLEHVSVMIYARTHGEQEAGYTFGRISEAFGSGRTGSVFIKLESGSSLVIQVREGPQGVDVATQFFPL